MSPLPPSSPSLIDRLLRFSLENKLVVFLLAAGLVFWGITVAPFDWKTGGVPRDPVPVDAIPDIGENQQIVFTEWPGRSPQDVEDQITYPLTTALLGLPEVKTVRSFSMFGFSSIYVIFKEDAEFYWSRSRILEKLNSLPSGLLPDGASPQLGPDATALGQVFWYTLQGRDEAGEPAGGWGPDELRSVQDWYVRYALQGVDGVAEVASIGGFVREYQIDVDPAALRHYDVSLAQVFEAVRGSNRDVGARTIEINRVEYVIRGLGLLENLDDLRQTVVAERDKVPVTLAQLAEIEFGPAQRRGALDVAGAEAVGGVVVTRYGENPLAVIQRVKDQIATISPGLPSKELADGRVSKVTIVPFYDRTGLIHETLGTLEDAVRQQLLVTLIVVVLMVMHLRSAVLISTVMPLAVLFAFVCMKLFRVDANIVALSGIAIAIGTIVDMGIVLTENVLKHLDAADPEENRLEVVYRGCQEVGSAVLTAVLTTVIGFLPVLTMEAAEGKLFRPLAYTKTFALIGSVVLALVLIPPLAHLLLGRRKKTPPGPRGVWISRALNLAVALAVGVWLALDWQPLGPAHTFRNLGFVLLSTGGILGLMALFIRAYPRILRYVLGIRRWFLAGCSLIVLTGLVIWLGFGTLTTWVPGWAKGNLVYRSLYHAFPGVGEEFMPDLDEGSFLLMPTTMPHASIGEALEVLQLQDQAIQAIPEVASVVGKIGRAESPLDPAPVSMIETVIQYHPEYRSDEAGRMLTFRYDAAAGAFARDDAGELIPDPRGKPFRQWRDHIQSPDDIWAEIVQAASVPGVTSAPKLQPIAARIVMLQSGMRAPMGLKVYGPDLETIEGVALELEALLRDVPSIQREAVTADRVVGKPYLEIDIDRAAIARYGLSINRVQEVIEVALGGKVVTQTIEGRERYPVRVRYLRELRDDWESIEGILVAAPGGAQVPLRELATLQYRRGPQMIKSEDTFLTAYVIFDKRAGYAEVEVVEQAQRYLSEAIARGDLVIPPGVSYRFTGTYENQIRAQRRLSVVLPISLAMIWLLLYFQFKRIATTMMVFSGVAFAWAGGFILIWLYGQPWFFNINLFGENLRDLFQMGTINLSVATWVGFLALFGIATDDGVLMGTYLTQRFAESPPTSRAEKIEAIIEAATRRIRPAMMTTATTVLALLPVLTSTGRGSDIMVPMAIPTFGGMLVALLTVFIVPVLFSFRKVAEARQES